VFAFSWWHYLTSLVNCPLLATGKGFAYNLRRMKYHQSFATKSESLMVWLMSFTATTPLLSDRLRQHTSATTPEFGQSTRQAFVPPFVVSRERGISLHGKSSYYFKAHKPIYSLRSTYYL
jgi:hypothetical protein